MLVCPRCGAQSMDGAPACSNCGAQFAVTPTMAYAPAVKQPGKGFAIAGMVCGICGIVICTWGIILGILGIIFGAVAKNKGFKGGMATAGIVLGCIALAFWVFIIFVGTAGIIGSL